MNAIRCIAGIVAVGAGLWLVSATDQPSGGREGAAVPVRIGRSPAESPALRGDALPYHGLAIQIHSSQNVASRYGRLIEEIAGLGADTVMISVNGYQQHVDSVRIERDPEDTPSEEDLLGLIAQAQGLGMRVILMPKILLRDPRGGAWRGQIKPPTWEGWFDQYRRFLRHYARLAQRGGVEVLILGSELVTTEMLTDQWVETIRQVRADYGGRLAYSANWDHYTSIQFWDQLDLMGVTTYHQLADDPGPSLADLLARWRAIRAEILDFQAQVGKPLLFTEAGWCSQEGCSVEAWNYYRAQVATPAGLEEQRRNYRAFVETWADQPALGGIIWWEWTEDAGGPTDYGYTPRNKPAEAVLQDLFRRSSKPERSR